ncbi:hypothetical protein E2C01_092597 [Portunus trituberculatus]|uniref:Uncharacterized protein n=1 Tax=Portunus trituberculatus TaxID=210409 RepID=A0A5B7JMF5_PORTR|nr:hypothetical protein [Portunus trituberculatus]
MVDFEFTRGRLPDPKLSLSYPVSTMPPKEVQPEVYRVTRVPPGRYLSVRSTAICGQQCDLFR